MKEKKKQISRVFALALFLALAGTPQFTLLRQANAQDIAVNGNTSLSLRALGIDNEARKIVSLVGAQVKFLNRGSELRQKNIVSPRDARSFFDEADARKSDLSTIKRELESLINKLKQANRWDEAFDAQFLALLKNSNARSVLTQAGGARKLFQAAVGEVSLLRDDIDDEVRQVNSKQTGALRNRGDRVLAAHARSPLGKICTVLLTAYFFASAAGTIDTNASCLIAKRYREKGCIPGLNTDCTH